MTKGSTQVYYELVEKIISIYVTPKSKAIYCCNQLTNELPGSKTLVNARHMLHNETYHVGF